MSWLQTLCRDCISYHQGAKIDDIRMRWMLQTLCRDCTSYHSATGTAHRDGRLGFKRSVAIVPLITPSCNKLRYASVSERSRERLS